MRSHNDPGTTTSANPARPATGQIGVETRLLRQVFHRDGEGRYGAVGFSPLNRWAVRGR